MIVKIDLENVNDRLKWRVILETLEDIGLPGRMVHTVMGCITSASFRILWNGKKLEKVKPMRGLRQGDLISPYISLFSRWSVLHTKYVRTWKREDGSHYKYLEVVL